MSVAGHLVIDRAVITGVKDDGGALLARALDTLSLASLGLPPRATLVVRRLTAREPMPRDGRGERFAAGLRDAVRSRIATARRSTTGDGDLLFEDEASLEAAMVADRMKGSAPAVRWWAVLIAPRNLRDHWRHVVLRDAVLLAPVISRLVASTHAPRWLAGFDDAELDAATARLLALCAPGRSVPREVARRGTTRAGQRGPTTATPWRATVATIAALVPETMAVTSPSARLLIATACTATRRPALMTLPGFVFALAELRDAPAPVVAAPSAIPAALADPGASGATMQPMPSPTCSAARSRLVAPAPAIDPARDAVRSVRLTGKRHPPSPPVPSTPDRNDAGEVGSAPLAQLATAHGGLFFLLNAFVAMGLFGNLADPRGSLSGLSPFELLDLLGSHWFGPSFRDDALHPLLRRLSGLEGRTPSGRDFDPPAWQVPPDWLRPWPGAKLKGARHPAGFRLGTARWPGTALARRRAWIAALAGYLDARLAAALGLDNAVAATCLTPARIAWTDSTVDVHMALDAHRIELRLAGLDRNPGYLPAAGRNIRFVFS